MLCPVEALQRRLKESLDPLSALFGYQGDNGWVNLTKAEVMKTLGAAWKEEGTKGLTGHSFRVGGASFRNAMEVPVPEIMKLGKWESGCYSLYLRKYKPGEVKQTKALIKELDRVWAKTS
jgi:hypothetical protein